MDISLIKKLVRPLKGNTLVAEALCENGERLKISYSKGMWQIERASTDGSCLMTFTKLFHARSLPPCGVQLFVIAPKDEMI